MDQNQRQPPEILRELTRQQWGEWKRHPVTALVLERYLPDFRRVLSEQTLQGWLDGRATLQHEQQARGHILGAMQMEGLSLDLLLTFYGIERRP